MNGVIGRNMNSERFNWAIIVEVDVVCNLNCCRIEKIYCLMWINCNDGN